MPLKNTPKLSVDAETPLAGKKGSAGARSVPNRETS
jgi:hypothetical protein